MAKGVKVGDTGTDHDGFPPTPVTAGSPDVNFDGQPAARVGDPLAPHAKPKHPLHGRTIASGSSTVFIDGKPAAITGGAISCGGVTVGSGTVNIGDKYQPASFSGLSQSEPSENRLGISSEHVQSGKDLSQAQKLTQGLTEEDTLIQGDTLTSLLTRILQSQELKEVPKLEQMAAGEKTLYRKGSEGEEVRRIQQGLIKLGYDLGRYGADGDFGNTTERRIKEFQNAYEPSHKTHANYKVGVADGIVGRNTLLALDEALVEEVKLFKKHYNWADSKFGLLLGKVESNNDYSAYNRTLGGLKAFFNTNLQEMSISAVIDKQKKRSMFAVGRFQIIPTTLQEAVTY